MQETCALFDPYGSLRELSHTSAHPLSLGENMKPNTIEEQTALEAEAASLSLARFERKHDQAAARGDAANSDAGRLAINGLMNPIVKRLDELIGEAKTGAAGRKTALAKYFKGCGLTHEEIAFLALRSCFHILPLYKSSSYQANLPTDATISRQIGLRLVDEMFLRSVKNDHPQLMKKWNAECEERSLDRDRARKFIRRQLRNLEIEWKFIDETGLEWDEAVQLKVGRLILEVITETTSICYVKTVRLNKKQHKKYVYVTPEFEEYMEKCKELLVGRCQMFLPMVVPPTPWSIEDGLYGGGYKTDHVRRYPMVKRASEGWLDQIVDNDPEVLVNSLNAIQETPWRVNRTVLEALEHVYGLDRELAGLPNSSRQELPPAPEEFSKDYRRICYEIHEKNRKQLTQRLFATQVIWLATKFSEYERFYFPHDLDSRGRAYPKPAFLNPQGPDYVKGLLEFADGKPLGTEDAAAWLAVHVANSFGEDKLAMDDRIQWTLDHSEMLREIAENPLDDLRWTQADNPFQFLSAAISWKGYLDEGLDYVCHTPIAVDATCSGLQHYSAMLLDSVGGRAVNLMALEERQDVYQDVASVATELVKEDLGTDNNNLAQAWLDFGIDRKVTKRSVMVVPYAATFMACMNYTKEGVRERMEKGEALPWAGDETVFMTYGAKKIWEAIGKTVVAASEAMRWISTASRAYAKTSDNQMLSWGTPSGFIVRHRKANLKPWRMDTVLDGTRITLQAFHEQPGLDPAKMSSSTPPSFVHSMDAAHMCLAIDAASYAGLRDFGVVHDSFATHASDMAVFSQCIRDTFYEMYSSQDILDGLRQQLQDGLEEELPPLPTKGDLDLTEVRESSFFFS